MDIFLAILEKETEGTCSTDRFFGLKKVYPLDEARDIYYKIRDFVELDGRQVACGVFIDEEEILSKDRFNHIEPKDQDALSYQSGRVRLCASYPKLGILIGVGMIGSETVTPI